ncbi:JAB domain-containing protein [Thomasclavelia cocleata]|jgi:DNA repair protein RadC|uniref:JAB domain-containing protein n=1 Tax=Thomasclavelia cocleata TaxID=69824 RepID=UPI00217093CE|nr:JAB domain-containing protein [Thomasclavelia cocleata]MCI9128385.1 DNA repair protein RadC [Eubacterium sp.]
MNEINIVSLKLVKDKTFKEIDSLTNQNKVGAIVKDLIGDSNKEMFGVVCLDTKLKPTNISITAIGGISICHVNLTEIIKISLLSNAYRIIAFHNHPSGDLNPSFSDIVTTYELMKIASFFDIKVEDHIIVGFDNDNIFSMNANNIINKINEKIILENAKSSLLVEDEFDLQL